MTIDDAEDFCLSASFCLNVLVIIIGGFVMDELYDKRIKTSFGKFDSMKQLEMITEDKMKFQDEYKGNTLKPKFADNDEYILRTKASNVFHFRGQQSEGDAKLSELQFHNQQLSSKEQESIRKEILKNSTIVDNSEEYEFIKNAKTLGVQRNKYRNDLYKQYMEEHGIKPDFISGSSMGSVVGCCYASGMSPDDMYKEVQKLKLLHLFDLSINAYRNGALLRSKKMYKKIDQMISRMLIYSRRSRYLKKRFCLSLGLEHITKFVFTGKTAT